MQIKCIAQQTERDVAISAYIYNFAKNVQWQNEENIKEFHFLVIGDDEKIVKELTALSKSKTLRKRPIKVSSAKTLGNIDNVQLIYITKGSEENLEQIFDKIEGKNILLVSDGYQNKSLVMINFFDTEDGNLLFEINKANIVNQHLEIMPDMILLGGSVVDVAALYYEGQQSLRSLQKQIENMNKNLSLLQYNLNKKNKELVENKDSLARQKLKLLEQEKILIDHDLTIAQQQKELIVQIKKIMFQQKIYDQQSLELTKQTAQLDEGNLTLENQKKEIDARKTEILSQKENLAKQGSQITRQQNLLSLLIIIIVLVVFLVGSILYAYLSKRKSNITLEKRVRDRTNDLNETNKQLQLELAERKLAEEALQKSEERYRLTLDNMLEGGQIVGFDFRYLYVNDAVALQGRKTKEELIGHTMMEVYPGIEHTALFISMKECITKRTSQHILNEFSYPDGSIGWFELSIQPVPEGIFILSYDITERQLIENKINKLNEELEEKVNLRTMQLETANKELEAFAYSVSHDLRAPLRAISGFTKILTEDYSEKIETEGQRICGIIQNEASRMGHLIDDLLSFSRLSRSSMMTVKTDMTPMVQEIFNDIKDQYPGHNVEFHLAELLPATIDVSLIRQVWINLLSNAFKFSSKKDIIKIEVGCYEIPGEIVYFVKDNGAGFDIKYVDKLFGVFQRLHTANEFYGTGVGLAIVQRILHRHGGRVWAEGEINKGAQFYFSLPDKK